MNNVRHRTGAGFAYQRGLYGFGIATSIVLVGCNLGAACSPFVLKWMGRFSEGVSVPFVGYAGMMGVLGIVLIVVTGRKK